MTYRQYADTQFNEEEDRYLPSDYFEPFEIETKNLDDYSILLKTKNDLEYRKWKYGGIGVFNGNKRIAFADNGSIQVSNEYQGQGIGLELVVLLKEINPNHRFGNMTPQGRNLMKKYYETKIANNNDIRYNKGGLIAPTDKIKFIDNRVLINGKDFGFIEFTIKENELEIRRLYLKKENQRVGIGRKIISELFIQNPYVDKILVYPLPTSIPFWLRFTYNVKKNGYFEITKQSLQIGLEKYPLKKSNNDIRFEQGGMTNKGYVSYKDKYNTKYGYKNEESHDLEEIAKDTGVSMKGLQQIYNKGIGAYKTNPQSVRPNVKSKEQWAMARVYSSVMGGKASKIDSNELKMNLGGLVGNTYTEIMYRVILSTETTTDIYATSTDLDDITSDYNSISPSDFDNPNSNSNTKELQSITKEYEFIGGDYFEAEDYIEDLDNTDFWTLTNEDTNDIESESVADINKATDEMIDEIREFIKEEYNIGGRYAEKYMTISVDDEDGEFITHLNIRTADHSQNTRNNDSNSFNLSFVIANLNATQNRFIPLGTEYYYDDNNDIEDIKEEIKGIIDEKIEEIKENREKFNVGGNVNNLSNKQKREVLADINKRIYADEKIYKLSADNNFVMRLDSRTNKYKSYQRFDLFYEDILQNKKQDSANKNARIVFQYLDKNGAELLHKSIYGSRYYIYKGNHIRVSSHSNQTGITDVYGIPKYTPYEETNNFYSYEIGGWEEMINKIRNL